MAAFTADNAFSGFSVDDIDAAKEFYGTTLGLDVEVNAMGFLDLRLRAAGRSSCTRSRTTRRRASRS